jgi:peptidoglycan/xylan/chitin deacetylase (PgdA/CDA1 family)
MTTIPIFLYHSVSRDPEPWIAPYSITPETFTRHVEMISDSGMTALTVSQLCDALTGRSALPERPVVITFDDGFADFAYAAQVLSKKELPSTLYVTTGALRGKTTFPYPNMAIPPAPMLDWRQLSGLVDMKVEIGAHSHTHPQLDVLPKRTATEEVTVSKEMLEDELGQQVSSFAYPHGFHSARTREIVRLAGFSSASAVMNALSSNRDHAFSLARLTVHATTTTEQFAEWLNGRGARIAPYPERAATIAWRMYRRARRGNGGKYVIDTNGGQRDRQVAQMRGDH